MFLVLHITYMRVQMRKQHNIYGNVLAGRSWLTPAGFFSSSSMP